MSDFTDRLRDGAHAIADKASDLAERDPRAGARDLGARGPPARQGPGALLPGPAGARRGGRGGRRREARGGKAPAKPRATKPKVTDGGKAAADTAATKPVVAAKPRGKEAAKGDEPKAAAAPRRRTGTKKTTE